MSSRKSSRYQNSRPAQGTANDGLESTLRPKHADKFLRKTPGWLSKLWSLFWVPIIIRQLIFRVPKKDHNFDNHPPACLRTPQTLHKSAGKRLEKFSNLPSNYEAFHCHKTLPHMKDLPPIQRIQPIQISLTFSSPILCPRRCVVQLDVFLAGATRFLKIFFNFCYLE